MEDTITKAELSDALANIGYIFGHNSLGQNYVFAIENPSGVARLIFKLVMSEREPEYEHGQIYRDVNGADWLRGENPGYPYPGDLVWHHVKMNFNAAEDIPVRPLRKLVPEESAELWLLLSARRIKSL